MPSRIINRWAEGPFTETLLKAWELGQPQLNKSDILFKQGTIANVVSHHPPPATIAERLHLGRGQTSSALAVTKSVLAASRGESGELVPETLLKVSAREPQLGTNVLCNHPACRATTPSHSLLKQLTKSSPWHITSPTSAPSTAPTARGAPTQPPTFAPTLWPGGVKPDCVRIGGKISLFDVYDARARAPVFPSAASPAIYHAAHTRARALLSIRCHLPCSVHTRAVDHHAIRHAQM